MAALAAACSATSVIYKTGDGITQDDYRVDPNDWPMTFFWPWKKRNQADAYRCSATMISDRVAVTAAHCIQKKEVGKISKRRQRKFKVQLNGGNGRRKIKEIRVDNCWNFRREGPNSNDLAMLFLDRPIDNAVRGVDYVEIWNPAEHGDEDLTGAEFIIAGWGMSGPFRDGSTRHLRDRVVFHRGFNEINEIDKNQVLFTMDQDGLELEAMGWYGDSGSGTFVER